MVRAKLIIPYLNRIGSVQNLKIPLQGDKSADPLIVCPCTPQYNIPGQAGGQSKSGIGSGVRRRRHNLQYPPMSKC
jgi:hypothetical protein